MPKKFIFFIGISLVGFGFLTGCQKDEPKSDNPTQTLIRFDASKTIITIPDEVNIQ